MSGHVRERLSAFLDDELPALEREAVEAHLRVCAACTVHLEVLRAVDAGTRALPVSVPPGYFEALPGRVRTRLQAAPRPRTLRLPVWTWAVAAVLLLVVVTPLTVDKARAPLPPEPAAPYPAPAGAPPSAAEGLVLSSPVEAPGKVAFERLDASKDDAEAKLRKRPAENRADRPEPPATFASAPAKEEVDVKAAPRLQDMRPAEQERSAPAPEPEAALESREPSRDEAQAPRREKAAGGTASGRVSSAVASSDERFFERLSTPVPSTLASLRERREAWRSFAREFPASPRADEARVRVIETGAEAWRVGFDPADLARVREDAAVYLARRDAKQVERVHAVLDGLPAAKP